MSISPGDMIRQGYSRAVREQVEAGVIELFNDVFGALASALTAKQGAAVACITRLMLAIPGATIHTFRELMNRARYAVEPAQSEGSPEPPPVTLSRADLPWKLGNENRAPRRNPDDVDMRSSQT